MKRKQVIARMDAFKNVAAGVVSALDIPGDVVAGDKDAILLELTATNMFQEDLVNRLSGDPHYREKLKDSYSDRDGITPIEFERGTADSRDDDVDIIKHAKREYYGAWKSAINWFKGFNSMEEAREELDRELGLDDRA
jgi:hypothetical protein